MSANYVNIAGGTTYTLTINPENLVAQKNQFRLICKTSGGAITIILPPISTFGNGIDAKVFIDDADDMCAINNITVQVGVGMTIANASDFVMNQNGEKIKIFISSKTEYGVLGAGGNGVAGTKTTLMGIGSYYITPSELNGYYLQNTLDQDITAIGIKKAYAELLFPPTPDSTIKTVSFPDLSEFIGGFYLYGQNTALLESASFPKIQAPANVFGELVFDSLPLLTTIDIPLFQYVGVMTVNKDLSMRLYACPLVTSFDMPNLTDINGSGVFWFELGNDIAIQAIDFSKLVNVNSSNYTYINFLTLPNCSSIDLSSLVSMSLNSFISFQNVGLITSVNIPTWLTGGGFQVSQCPLVTSVSFANLTAATSVFINDNPLLVSISLPLLNRVDYNGVQIASNASLLTINFPLLTYSGGDFNVGGNNALTSISLGGSTLSFMNAYFQMNALTQVSVDDILNQFDTKGIVNNLINYDTLVGAFQIGETITGGTSGATGVIVIDDGGTLRVQRTSGASFSVGETITGGTSLATANTLFIQVPILNLSGGANATPSAAGLVSKASLIAKGWNVVTN